MEAWKECKLGDISTFKYGTMPKKDRISENGMYPIFSGYRIVGYYDEYNLENSELILIARGVGGTGDVKLSPEKCYLTNLSIVIFLNENILLKKYAYYYFTLNNLRYLDSGSAQSQITISDLSKVNIKLPPLATQQKIARILSSLDDKIELNNKINTNLEQQAQALFKNWFVDFEPFGGKMPEGWKVGKLEDIADYYNGYAFSSKELLNEPEENCLDVFKQGHIKKGGGFIPDGTKSWYPLSKCQKLKNYILKKGDILMAMTDMKGNVAILGNTAIMPVDDKYIVNQRVGLLRAKENLNIDYPYLYLLTNDHDFLMDLRSRANSGVQVNLSSTAIKESEVNIAPKEVYKQFNDIIMPLFEKILANQQENQKLANIRDTLLPKLMNGEIEV